LRPACLKAGQIERNLKKKLAGLVIPKGIGEAEQIDKLLTDPQRECRELTVQIEQRKARVEQLKKRIIEAEQKRSHIAELEQTVALYAKLGTLLRAEQVIQFVLEHAFDLLSSESTHQYAPIDNAR
jgi:hypothetical protein